MLEVITYDKDEAPIKQGNMFGDTFCRLEDIPGLLTNDKLKKAAENFLFTYSKQLNECPASISKHHWWTGGLRDHIEQVVNIACEHAYSVNSKLLRIHVGTKQYGESYTTLLDRVIIGALLHDAEKVNRYQRREANKPPRFSTMNRDGKIYSVRGYWEYTPGYSSGFERHIAADLESIKIASECGFPIEDWLVNAIVFAAGGYSPLAKEMQPTNEGVILHVADYTSASIFFNMGA